MSAAVACRRALHGPEVSGGEEVGVIAGEQLIKQAASQSALLNSIGSTEQLSIFSTAEFSVFILFTACLCGKVGLNGYQRAKMHGDVFEAMRHITLLSRAAVTWL